MKLCYCLLVIGVSFLGACGLSGNEQADGKEVFRMYLGMKPPADVDSLHAFTDFIGIDYKVLIAFECDFATLKRIVKKNELALSDEHDNGLRVHDKLYWWDNQVMEAQRPYKRIMPGRDKDVPDGDQLYLWYDAKTKRAYYEQFSM